MIQTTIREYYLLIALKSSGSGMIAATYATFLMKNGLNLLEINLVNFVFFLTLFICEIPTGAFADLFGRKRSYIVACLLMATSFTMYACSQSIFGFIVAEIIGGIGSTFASGAFRAWFVDKLKHHGYEGKFHQIFARGSLIGQVCSITSALIGGYLATKWLGMPWVAGATFALATAIAASTLKEEYFIRKKFSWQNGLEAMRETISSSIRYGLQNQNIRFVLVVVTFQILCVQAPNMQWQPLFVASVTHESYLSWVWVGVALSIMVGNWCAPRMLKKFTCERRALATCQILVGIGIAIAAMVGFPASLIVFFLHEMARGAFGPIKDSYLHDNIPSKERATIDSFESIAHHGGGMIGLLASGILAVHIGIPWTWFCSGLLLVVSTLLVFKNGKGR